MLYMGGRERGGATLGPSKVQRLCEHNKKLPEKNKGAHGPGHSRTVLREGVLTSQKPTRKYRTWD